MEENFENQSEVKKGFELKIWIKAHSEIIVILCMLLVVGIVQVLFINLADKSMSDTAPSVVEQAINQVKTTNVIPIESKAGGYFSKELKIILSIYTGESGEERDGIITLRAWGKNGEIIIERYKTQYISLLDAEKHTSNEVFKNANKQDIETHMGYKGRRYDVKDSTRRIYSLYFDGYIYNFVTDEPELYKIVERYANSVRYIENPEEYFRPIPTVTLAPKYILSKKSSTGLEELFEFQKNGLDYIYRWKDTLLYTYMYGEDDILTIFQHDITSGKTTSIFTKETKELAISDLNIINDVLYFYLGAYMRDGESYWIDLNSKDKTAHKMVDYSGGITKLKDRYYIITGEGDACWGTATYSLFDLDTKKITPVAETNIGCVAGDEFIGITNDDHMVLANHEGGDMLNNSIYNHLVLIPLSAIPQRKSIPLPKDIVYVKLYEDNDELLLISKENAYIYNLKESKLDQIVDYPKEFIDFQEVLYLEIWDRKSMCLNKSNEHYTKKMRLQVDIDNKSFVKNDEMCPEKREEENITSQQSVEKFFKDLNLPDNYLLIRK